MLRLLQLRRFLTEILLDQLPLLRELKRLLEELSILNPPPPTASSLAIIEQIPEMREGILRDQNFQKIAEEQKRTVFSNDESARQRDIARLAATYNLDKFEEVASSPTCAECQRSNPGQMKRCARCKNEWYCGRACQVANWKKHQKVCDIIANGAGGGAGAAAAGSKKPAAAPATAASVPASSAASAAAAKPAATANTAAKPAAPAASSSGAAKPAASTSTSAAAPAASSKSQPAAAAPSAPSKPTPAPSTAAPGAKKPLIEVLDDEPANPLESPD
jgi:hypothetical protein